MMKKIKKQLLAGLLTAVMAVSAFASATPAEAASLSAEQYLTKMAKATEKAKSYEMKMSMDMDLNVNNETTSAKSTTTSIVFSNPMKMKTVTSMTTTVNGKPEKSKSVSYAKQKNNKLLMYTSADGKKYDKTTMNLSDYSDMLGSLQTTDMYSDLKIVKNSVKVNGKTTAQIKAQVKGEAIANLLAELGIGSNDPSGTSYDYSSLAPITYTIWIDKKTYCPVKQTIDMKDFMNGFLSSLTPDVTMSYPKIKVSITYKNFNNATKFSLPKACK